MTDIVSKCNSVCIMNSSEITSNKTSKQKIKSDLKFMKSDNLANYITKISLKVIY